MGGGKATYCGRPDRRPADLTREEGAGRWHSAGSRHPAAGQQHDPVEVAGCAGIGTFYMPNTDWRRICERGCALREAEGTLTGRAAGHDRASVVGTDGDPTHIEIDLPEPLAAIVDYLGNGLVEREFVPTAELVEVLGVEPTMFGKEMGELGCRPVRQYLHEEEGTRRVRGYLTADLRAAIAEIRL